eukprot:GSMAST32.ASY1.ANO1.1938.1 assembled CDS
MGPSRFPVDQVQRIAIFDVRTINTDRHSGNILVNGHDSGDIVLVPIDHSFCLPRVDCLADVTLDWVKWPQTKQPMSKTLLDYIEGLDAEADVKMLNFALNGAIKPESLRTLRVGTLWLKEAAAAGLTLQVIGQALCRGADKQNEPSDIEKIVAIAFQAENCAGFKKVNEESTQVFMSAIKRAMRMHIQVLQDQNKIKDTNGTNDTKEVV